MPRMRMRITANTYKTRLAGNLKPESISNRPRPLGVPHVCILDKSLDSVIY